MSAELGKLGLNSKGSIPTKITRLTEHIRKAICGSSGIDDFNAWVLKNPADPNVAVCEPGCGGISLLSEFELCPFCGDRGINMPDETKAIVKAEPQTAEIISLDYLEQNVQTIRNLKLAMSENFYSLGLALKEKCLWALRKKKSGEPKYKNFEAWARAEVKLGRTQAMKCIHVVENFTEEEVRRIGHTKLAIALQVPPQHRDELVKQAEEGASKRELERAAAELKGKTKPEEERVIPLMAKPRSPEEELVPACCLGDEPFAIEHLSNGVVQSYQLTEDADGNLVLLVKKFRKES
jgi:hypothetical protein